MSKKTVELNTNENLSRWWWPGQWLRIVYSVWIDQAWYRKNVYPQLKDEQRKRKIFFQAILGTTIVTLTLSFILRYLLTTFSVQIDAKWVLLGSFLGIFGSVLFTGTEGENKVIDGVILGTNLGVLGSLFLGLYVFFDGDIDWNLFGGMELWAGCLNLILGISYGLRERTVKHERPTLESHYLITAGLAIILTFIFFGMLDPDGILAREYIVLAFISILASVPGAYLGNRWAIRQGNR